MTQETIELKLKMTLESLEQSGFDMTSYTKDMNEQETLEDYEEIYNMLKSHIECLKGINLLDALQRKISELETNKEMQKIGLSQEEKSEDDNTLENLVNDIIEVIYLFRNNKKTLYENKNIKSLENNFYDTIYKIITKEIIENLNSEAIDVVLEDEYDSLRLSEIIYKHEIKNIEKYELEYDKSLIDMLKQKLDKNNKNNNMFYIDKELMIIIVSILHTEEIRKSSESKLEKLIKSQKEYMIDINRTENETETFLNRKEIKLETRKKINKSIKTRIIAFLASLGILVSASTFTMKKLESGYTSYETTHIFAYTENDNLIIKPSREYLSRKINDSEQALLTVYYDSFETSTGPKQYVEEFELPKLNVEDIKDYINIDTSTLTLHSWELKDKGIESSNRREIVLENQNLDNKVTEKGMFIALTALIICFDVLLSMLPFMPIYDIEKLRKLLKERKREKEYYDDLITKITDYIDKINGIILNSEQNIELYNTLKKLSTALKFDFKRLEQFETLPDIIEEAKENIKKLQK